MSTHTPAPIGDLGSHVLPPSVVQGTSITALARVGTAHKVFEVAPSAPAPVMEGDADGDDDYSVPMVLPGVPNPSAPKKRSAAPAAAPVSGLSEDEEGGVLGEYARVAAAGTRPKAPATTPVPQKHCVNERVMTLGELVAERRRQRDPVPVVESEHTGLSTLRAMFPKR